jgi:hypothetical protein
MWPGMATPCGLPWLCVPVRPMVAGHVHPQSACAPSTFTPCPPAHGLCWPRPHSAVVATCAAMVADCCSGSLRPSWHLHSQPSRRVRLRGSPRLHIAACGTHAALHHPPLRVHIMSQTGAWAQQACMPLCVAPVAKLAGRACTQAVTRLPDAHRLHRFAFRHCVPRRGPVCCLWLPRASGMADLHWLNSGARRPRRHRASWCPPRPLHDPRSAHACTILAPSIAWLWGLIAPGVLARCAWLLAPAASPARWPSSCPSAGAAATWPCCA